MAAAVTGSGMPPEEIAMPPGDGPARIAPLAPATLPAPAAPLPMTVARQILHAIAEPAGDPGAPVELSLDPPELGRLRVILTDGPAGLALAITAERPETADLLRRHLALLAQECARAGIDALAVDISGDGRRGRPPPDPPPGDHAPVTSAPRAGPAMPSVAMARVPIGGLDLRI
jgi:hypothetical protein